ncbi:hypothetical protein LTR17_002684 [Elasticomyces elasticus]|nr:hypothetical protein LTR17_002684 [Elasticomyces elasticus]
MAQQAEANISGLREQIKGEQCRHAVPRRYPAAGAFTVVVTSPSLTPPDVYCASLAYLSDQKPYERQFKHLANGDHKSSVHEALQSLLDTTALALGANLTDVMVRERDAEYEQHGEGRLINGRVTPARTQANAVILFADQVSVSQVGGSPIPVAEAFTIAVTRPWAKEYRAYLVYYQGSFKKAAHGEKKKNVLGALQSLLDTLASELDARFVEKVGSAEGMDWVIRGEGEVMRDYAGDLGGL